jgi:tetratricopeptide (TPR) repeat protein
MTAHAADENAEWKRLNHEGMKALERSDPVGAKAAFYNAVVLADNFGPKDSRFSQSYRALGFSALQMQDYPTADLGYTRAIRGDEARLGSNDLVVASDLLGLVEAARQLEEFVTCHESLERAAKIVEAKQGGASPAMGLCCAARGAVEFQEAHFSAAETNLERAIRLLDKTAWVLHAIGPEEQLSGSFFQPPQILTLEAFTNYAACLREQKR